MEAKKRSNGVDKVQLSKVNKLEKDSQRIFSLRECLKGIPPPPSLTNPKVSVDEALFRLKNYIEWETSSSSGSSNSSTPATDQPCSSIVESSTHDIYYNDSSMCETLDTLYERLRQRCITHETSSFTGTPPPLLPPESPLACDLADLLPRSLSSPASPAPDSISLELLAHRRRGRLTLNTRQHTDSRRQSPRKTKIPIKNPQLCLAGALAIRDLPASSHRTLTTAQTIQKTKIDRRFIAVNKKKTTEQSSSKVPDPPVIQKEEKLQELSMTHRKKLLWATSTAFKRAYPALSSDATIFRRRVSALYRLCQTQWLVQREDPAAQVSQPTLGTSERMLELATKLAPQVINTL